MVGNRIRAVRQSRNLSLTDLADRADISAATLSRIERDKQNLDLELFLTLSRILKMAPHELLGETDASGDSVETTVRSLGNMQPEDRARFWRSLAADRKNRTSRASLRNLTATVDELLAQIEYVRLEVEAMQKRLRRG